MTNKGKMSKRRREAESESESDSSASYENSTKGSSGSSSGSDEASRSSEDESSPSPPPAESKKRKDKADSTKAPSSSSKKRSKQDDSKGEKANFYSSVGDDQFTALPLSDNTQTAMKKLGFTRMTADSEVRLGVCGQAGDMAQAPSQRPISADFVRFHNVICYFNFNKD